MGFNNWSRRLSRVSWEFANQISLSADGQIDSYQGNKGEFPENWGKMVSGHEILYRSVCCAESAAHFAPFVRDKIRGRTFTWDLEAESMAPIGSWWRAVFRPRKRSKNIWPQATSPKSGPSLVKKIRRIIAPLPTPQTFFKLPTCNKRLNIGSWRSSWCSLLSWLL